MNRLILFVALKSLPIGTAYAGTAVAGMWLFGEPVSPGRFACLKMIVAGVVGLKLTAV